MDQCSDNTNLKLQSKTKQKGKEYGIDRAGTTHAMTSATLVLALMPLQMPV